MRSSRLMAILLLCQGGDRWTAARLADRLEVSVRTIYRDITELQSSGVPMWTESGPGGGIRLLEGWRNNLGDLTGEEVAALHLAGIPSAASDLGLGTVALNAQLKVRTALPPELRSRSARIQERFHLDAPGWFNAPEDVSHLPTIADAVWSSRRLRLHYGRDAEFGRTVEPLGLVLKAGVWYLVATDRTRTSTFRVSRVRDALVLPDSFARPDEFVLSQWWTHTSGEFGRSLLRDTCRLALSPAARRRLPHVTDLGAAQRALDSAIETPAWGDEWAEVTLEIESEAVAVDQLLCLGEGFQVLHPPSLRTALHDVATTVALRHVGEPSTR